MSNIDTINVGGLDYSIEDSTARETAEGAVTVSAYVENGNTASRAYSVLGTPINWKGSLYYTKATIAQGATLSSSNLTAAANLGAMMRNIKTYVGTDSKLHFTDATGADSVLPFKGSMSETKGANGNNSTALINVTANTSSRAVITKSANFTTTKPCIVFGAIGCDWPTQSGKVVIHGVTLTMANTASNGLASFAWFLPDAGSYSISMSASVADQYYFYAAYVLFND